MKRLLFALFAIALLTPFALQRDGQAQTTPMFTDSSAETVYLQSASDGSGSGNAITIISPSVQNGASSICDIGSARGVGGSGAVTHVTTGGTDLSSSFNSTRIISGGVTMCRTQYTGAASVSTRVAASLTHIHLAITVRPGATDPVSDTKNVTIKLVNLDTDKAALDALYAATGGASWTNNTNWTNEWRSRASWTLTSSGAQSFGGGALGFRVGTYGTPIAITLWDPGGTHPNSLCVGVPYGPRQIMWFPNINSYRQRTSNGAACRTGPDRMAGIHVRITKGTTSFVIAGGVPNSDSNWDRNRDVNGGTLPNVMVSGESFTFEYVSRTQVGDRHGVTVSSGRVTGLALPSNNLRGGPLPDALGELTALTTLNLSGNAGLDDGPIPAALTSLTALTTLNLGTTGLCSNASTSAWVAAIATTTVTACAGPTFATAAASFTQDASATSASYAITIGTGNLPGGTDVCSVAEAAENASAAPADHDSSTGTAITGFSASVTSANTCTLSYSGAALTRTAGTREAISLTLNVGDGLQPADPDDTIDVTIKLLDLETDKAALAALFTNTSGSGWTEGWGRTFPFTGAAGASGTGYYSGFFGSVRGGASTALTANGTAYTLTAVYITSGNAIGAVVVPEGTASDFDGLNLTIGGTTLAFSDASDSTGFGQRIFSWGTVSPALAASDLTGSFEAAVWGVGDAGALHGVTVTNNRVTAIELPGNNLFGALPRASMAELTRLATLDLSGNVDLDGGPTSEIAALTLDQISDLVAGSLGMESLTTLDLTGTGICFAKTPASRTAAQIAWLAAIEARSGGSAAVSDCGPRFVRDRITVLFDTNWPANVGKGWADPDGPPGAGVAPFIGGALGTPVCPTTGNNGWAVRQAASPDPDNFVRPGAGTTFVNGFAMSTQAANSSCHVSYNFGSPQSSYYMAGTREAISILLRLNNGVNHLGASDTSVDDDIEITIRLMHNGTDLAALQAFYDGAGGASWTTNTNWSGAATTGATLGTTNPWHGVTLGTSGVNQNRVTALDLSDNNLAGASAPALLGELTRLANLDLSDNANLAGPIPAVWAEMVSMLTIDLRGTGLCAEATNARVQAWLTSVRAKSGSSVNVPSCEPQFAEDAVTFALDAGEAGPTVIGTPAFSPSLVGGTARCTLDGAVANASGDAAMHATTGTDSSSLFTVNASTCAISYTGSGATRTATTLEAYSLTISLDDGVGDGLLADDTIDVTVRLVDADTDQAALDALYTATTGGSWTTATCWATACDVVFRTFPISGGDAATRSGYASAGATGSLRSGNGQITLSGTTYTLYDIQRRNLDANTPILLSFTPSGMASHFDGLKIRIGSVTLELDSATESTFALSGGGGRSFRWSSTALTRATMMGNFDLELLRSDATPPPSVRHGVTVDANGRVTGLNLNNNNLAGNIPAELADLTKLRTLDLGGNGATLRLATPGTGLTGLTALTSLTLTGSGICEDTMPDDGTLAMSVRDWLQGLRGAGATVSVTDCALGGPQFTATSITYLLDAGADGSGTAIVVGAPAFTAGTIGGTDACRIGSQLPTTDDETFVSTGTDVSLFTIAVDSTTCALSFGGAAATSARTAGTLEGWSVVIEVHDGVDGAGVADTSTDSSINVTVKLVDGNTDREILDALYAATSGGSGWTTTNWVASVAHTFELTAGAYFNTVGTGYQQANSGSVRSGNPATLGGTTITVYDLLRIHSSNRLQFRARPTAAAASFFGNSILRIGANDFAFSAGTRITTNPADYTVRWSPAPANLFTDGVDFDAQIIAPAAALASRTGVTVTSGRVTGLALPGNNLVGTLPDSLWQLNKLATLDLSGNTGLTGPIPATIGELTTLTSLDLSGGGLSGAIPAGIGSLTALTALDLSDNALTGTLEDAGVVSLTALTELDLSGNGLTGAIPSGISALTSLTDLDLSDNGLTDGVPALGALTALTSLDLSGNALSGTLASAGLNSLTALTSLNLGDNALTGSIPTLAALAAITSLDLGGNTGLSGGIPAALGGLTTLTTLDLGGSSGLGMSIPVALGSLTALTTLDLSNTGVTGGIPTQLETLTALTTLDLSHNRGLSGNIPAELAALTMLTTLDLSDTALSGEIPAALAALTALTTLDLRDTIVCVLVEADLVVVGWLNGLRDPMRTPPALAIEVANCDTTGTNNRGPSFASPTLVIFLDAGDDGSTTAVAVATPAITEGNVAGAADTCTLVTQFANASDATADFIEPGTSGATATTDFTVNTTTCAITYTGSGATRTNGTLEAYSLTITLTDGVNDAGSPDRRADATLRATVKLLDASTDQAALWALHQATGGSSWTANTNWGAAAGDLPTSSNAWSGVTLGSTGADSGRVTALALSNNNLVGGPLPGQLRELSRLTSLDLSDNDGITGAIPAGLGDLSRLTNLFLNGNDGLTGRIPGALGRLSAVRTLRLHNNPNLSGPIPPELGDMAALRQITLYNAGLTGTIPAELGQLSMLRSMLLTNNPGLTGSIPPEMTALTTLTNLGLTETGVCVDPAAETDVETWLNGFRASPTGGAFVHTCNGRAPAFAEAGVSFGLDAGADGSTTPIALAMPAWTGGTFSGGATTTCRIDSAVQNPSADPDSFATTGTDASSLFNVADVSSLVDATGACVLTYEGSGATRTAGALEAYSVTVAIYDGVDDGGAVDTTTSDATFQVTVKILDGGTDATALWALYQGAGGEGWTARTGWTGSRTIQLTGAADSGASTIGYFSGAGGHGSIRAGTATFTLSGRTYTLAGARRDNTPVAIELGIEPQGTRSHLNGLTLTIGSTTLNVDDASESTYTPGVGGRLFRWTESQISPALAASDFTGSFDAVLASPGVVPALSASWSGVMLNAAGRATALALADNGLRGEIPAGLGDLSALTSLDLSGNTGLRGSLPRDLTRLENLLTLNLEDTRICSVRDAEVRTWLDGIRAKTGGSVTLGVCPSGATGPTSVPVTVSVATRGNAPADALYNLQLACGGTPFSISLGAGGSYSAVVSPAAVCSLSVTDRAGALSTLGEFTGRSAGGGISAAVTMVYAETEPEPEANPLLERRLVVGSAFVRWTGERATVAEAVAALTLRVTAVHWWDASAQQWRSWFPGGEDLGVNTLESFAEGAIYFVFAEEGDDGVPVARPGDALDPGEAVEEAAAIARLDRTLVADGAAFVRWQAGRTSLDRAVDGLRLNVTAVHGWDANAQRWRSWFPGGAEFGVNTLAALDAGGIYFVFSTEREEEPEPETPAEGDDETVAAPNPQLEGVVAADRSVFVRWQGEALSVGRAVAGLTLRVTLVRMWDAERQRWREWIPNGAQFGLNTLTRFEPGVIYTIFAEERAEPDPPATTDDDGDAPADDDDGDAPATGDGDAPAGDDGDAPATDDGDAPATGDGDAPADDDGDAPATGDGATPADDDDATPADDGDATDAEPNPQLEAALVAGTGVFVRWQGESTSVAEAVAGLTLRVTSVRVWDTMAQRWLEWLPGGAEFGVNTLHTLEPNAIYTIVAEAR